MSKGYWLAVYKAIHDADQLAAYAKKASGAIAAGGGKFLSRGMPVAMLEGDEATRTVLIEFPSAQAAIDTYNSEAYATRWPRLAMPPSGRYALSTLSRRLPARPCGPQPSPPCW